MSRLLWLAGGSALTWFAWQRERREPANGAGLHGRWVWPVPRWQNRLPTISDGFDSPRPDHRRHRGVDVMFARAAGDHYLPGTPNASSRFVMPDDMVALAAADGTVWSAGQGPRGFSVLLDHSPFVAVATFYTHLEKLLVVKGERVRAGQPIGIVGADPLDPEHLKHLHFELWRGGPDAAVDPAPLMRSWSIVGDPRVGVLRNAALTYRGVGASGERYPAWVRELDGKAGVYIIRDAESRTVLYVGSSAGRLYDTLTRHFQRWRRFKGFWRGQFGEGHDPGLTYDRDTVEVAVRLTSPTKSLDEEMRLIARLRPRDNLIGQPAEPAEEVPF